MNRKLSVALFSNHFVAQHGEGIARYSHRLYDALQYVQPDIDLKAVSSWRPHGVHDLPSLQKRLNLRFLPWGKRATGLSWAFFKRPFLERGLYGPVDIVHSLSVFYPTPTRKPLVATVHDIMPITHPEFFPKSITNFYSHFMRIGLNYILDRAAAIICVSQTTASELEGYARRNLGNRLHVIWEGVAPIFLGSPDMNCLQAILPFKTEETPFVLCVGGVIGRKNVGRLIQAMEKLKDEIPHHLVFAGGVWWGADEILRQVRESPISDRIHYLGYVSDNQLHALYQMAKVFVFVSLFEGFGLPVVEALASGCPVVTSNISSLPEIAGDAALCVDPYSVKDIAEAIREVCMDDALAGRLRERGRRRGKAFCWNECARRVVDIYRRVV